MEVVQLGSSVELSCDSCRFTTTKMVGVGFLGIDHVIAICRACRKLVGREYSVFEHSEPPDFPCEGCGALHEVIWPPAGGMQDASCGVDLGNCAKCEGRLLGEFPGLMWD